MEHVSEFIRQTRRQKNLTQKDLAVAANTTAQFISLVEKNRTKLSIKAAKRIAEKFNLNHTKLRKAYELDYLNEFVHEWNESK